MEASEYNCQFAILVLNRKFLGYKGEKIPFSEVLVKKTTDRLVYLLYVHMSPKLDHLLSPLNPSHLLTLSLFDLHFYIVRFLGALRGEGQARLGQVRLGQVRLGQVRLGQVRLGQVMLGQVILSQVRLGYIRLVQVRLAQVRLGQVMLGQVRLGQVILGQFRLGYVRLAQVRLGQVRLGQVSLGQVRLGALRGEHDTQYLLG